MHRGDMNFGPFCVALSGVAEQWVKATVVSPLLRYAEAEQAYTSLLRNGARVLALGGNAKWCRNIADDVDRGTESVRVAVQTSFPKVRGQDLRRLGGLLRDLDRHRRGLAHGEGILDRHGFEGARKFVFAFLNTWVPLFKPEDQSPPTSGMPGREEIARRRSDR